MKFENLTWRAWQQLDPFTKRGTARRVVASLSWSRRSTLVIPSTRVQTDVVLAEARKRDQG